MSENALVVSGLRYRTPAGERGPVDLAVQRGEVALLRLPSIDFPQLLLEVVATLDPPLAGRIDIGGHDAERELRSARRQLAWLPPDGGYVPNETPEQMLRRVARWRRSDATATDRVRERFVRWSGEPWPAGAMSVLPARCRVLLRLACALTHAPSLLLTYGPLDRLPAPDRPSVAAALAQVAADGTSVLLCDGSVEAALLAERTVPSSARGGWLLAARWDASTAHLQRQAGERGWPGWWQVGLRGGSCRLGPFVAGTEARAAAAWLLAADPLPTAVWMAPVEETA